MSFVETHPARWARMRDRRSVDAHVCERLTARVFDRLAPDCASVEPHRPDLFERIEGEQLHGGTVRGVSVDTRSGQIDERRLVARLPNAYEMTSLAFGCFR